jgi:signal transduction histidine kinase
MITEWLQNHDAADCDPIPLAESPLTADRLDALERTLDRRQLAPVIRYLSEEFVLRRLTSEIETAATRIHTLVAAVKGFTYMDQETIPTPVDVAQGLSDTLTVMRSMARSKSATLELEVAPNLPRFNGFGGELNQTWGNLIANAIDAVPQNGKVHVSAAREGDELVVQVADNGPGIPPDIQTRIFDPFFTTKGVGRGTGLGLDIARRVVERHNGTLTFSTGSAGTTFRVALPLKKTARARLQ